MNGTALCERDKTCLLKGSLTRKKEKNGRDQRLDGYQVP
jgi:hypothetical protein